MKVPGAIFCRYGLFFLWVTGLFVPLHAQQNFSVQLSQGGLTSAGIFDSNGRIVRTLWALETFNAGNLNCSWDARDDLGAPVPPGSYTWKVLRNGAQYNNVGVIGNTGLPPITSGHVPSLIEGVAVDSQGNPYSVHDWDEPHFDVIRWSPVDGKSVMNTGHPVGEALLKAIAVEPDGSFAYVTGYGDSLTDRTKSKFSIWRINLAPQLSESQRVANFTQQGRCIKVYDGSAGGYPGAGYPTPAYPANATEADKDVMRVPLISIAVQGSSLYVTDAIGGRIVKYDKVSGNHQSTITGVSVACGLAIASDGNIWVGHEHTKVSVYSPAGVRLATPIMNLAEVRALSIQGNMLAVADRVGVVRKYTINGTQVTLTGSYGLPQRPGDRKPERLSSINGMVMDASGNIYISDRLGDGSRLQKINSQLAPVWQQMCLEFSSSAAYGTANPDLLISSYRKAYQIDKATGGWTLLGTAKTDVAKSYFGNYESTHLGPPRIVRWGTSDFYYYPAGDSLAIFRIEPPADAERGPTLKLASVLGASQPSPDGLHRDETWHPANRYFWEWNDTQGDGQIQYTPRSDPGQAGEVTLLGLPYLPHPDSAWFRRAFEVDHAGWVWMASANRNHLPDVDDPWEGEAIYVIPSQGLNNIGNPIYSWRDAVRVADADTGRNALNLAATENLEWKMVGRSDDGMVYALAWSNKTGLPQDGGLWMGGNVLFGFLPPNGSTPTSLGQPKWRVVLPKQSVGMVPIPGGPGGVLVGIDPPRGTVGHYTKDGLLIGSMKTAAQFNDPTREPWVGCLDAYLAVNCNRDPRDGLVDVFVEDNMNQRIVWYRVNDSNVQTAGQGTLNVPGSSGTGNVLSVINGTGDGTYPAGITVNLAAAAASTNKVFAGWTGNTTGVADVNSPNTTLVMPNSAVTVTATYKWATGNDKIRFYPEPGQEQQMLTSLWEGTNEDRNTGAYEVFYQPEQVPIAGWNEVMVNTRGFRYLRWRQTTGNGMIRELEWYRSNVRLTGPFFGTPGSWQNNPNATWDRAVDGNTSTGFNGPDSNQPGWINPYIGVDSRPGAHTLTVNNGTGSGSYDPGTSVLVSAREPLPGEAFAWTGDRQILANWLMPTTSALMPSRDVSITATYGSDGASTLTVINGSGGGSHPVGATVNVVANSPPAGQVFAGWTGDTVILADQDPSRASTTAIIPSLDVEITATYVAGSTGTGLRAQYYNDNTTAYPLASPFAGSPALTRTDATVDFNWGTGSPGSPVTSNYFSAKWVGKLKAPASTSYTFTVTGDDGVRLFLNGVKVIDGWMDQGATPYSHTTTLTAGTLYDIELHYYEHAGDASCRLQWSYLGQSTQPIPQSQLYPPSGQQQVAAPTFNPAPGTYSGAQSVAITSAETGALIRYTTDGSTPTSTATLYNGPVTISNTTTLKAVAFKTGMDDSSVTGGTYTINIIPTYTLTVNGGTGGGVYAADTIVNVNATTPPGQQFVGWAGNTDILTSQAQSTTAKMPASNASLTAMFSTIGGPGTGLRGEYYNDSNAAYPLASPFAGSPVLTRTDTTVNFNWGSGSPGAPVTANYFSVKWTGKLKAPVTGSYTFTVTGDDGVRLFLNGVKVIDGWIDQGATSYSYTTTLTANTLSNIELHYYEHAENASIRLRWSYPGQVDETIPQSALRTTGALTREVWTGITGDGVSNIPTGSVPTLTDTLTSFEAPSNWADNYGTRVRGYITAPGAGSYRFWIASDNASELWLSTDSNPANKRRIARVTSGTNPRQWTKQSNQRSAAISLVQGQIYYVEALQKEGTGNDNLAVGWAKPGQSTSAPSEIIPGAVLSPFQ